MSKKIFIFLCALTFLSFSLIVETADAASLKVSSFTFSPNAGEDIMGPGGNLSPDGKPDAAFSLSLSGASAITEITLKNEHSGMEWSTNSSKAFIALNGSDGQTINSAGRLSVLPVLLAANYKLYVSDAGKEITKETTYVVTVKLIDGSSLTAKTEVSPLPGLTAEYAGDDGKSEGITSVRILGVSGYDLAGSGESIGADGKKDTELKARFLFKNARITGMKIRVQDGNVRNEWDTLKGNGIPLIVVLDKGENIANKADGSVSINIDGAVEYTLLVQHRAGIFTNANASGTLTISLADGRVFVREIEITEAPAPGNTVAAEYKGRGSYDFVGENEKLESNLNADSQINAKISASGTISGIRIKAANGKLWDTIPGNGNWLTAVTNSKGEKLNRADGSVSIPVNGSADFSLWFEEDAAADGPFAVTFVLANGQVLEAATQPSSKGKTAENNKDAREIKFLTAKPAETSLDIVGKNKKLTANGARDHAIKVQIKGTGQIIAMTLKDTSGMGWDTLPANNGRWRLAVRDGNKTANGADGAVKIPVSGTKEFTLVAQNNGKLSASRGRLILEVSWSDGAVTEKAMTW